MPHLTQSCLILKNDGIGDLILSSGVIAEISRRFDRTDLVTCQKSREIARWVPGLNRIMTVPLERPVVIPGVSDGATSYWLPTPSAIRLRRELMGRRYDVAIVLRRFIRRSTIAMMAWVNADQRIVVWQLPTNLDRATAESQSCDWEHHQAPVEVLSEPAYFSAALGGILGADLDPTPRLDLPPSDDSPVAGALGIGMGAMISRWPRENWLELIQLLSRNWKVQLFGGPDAVVDAAWLQQSCPGLESHVGRLSLSESIPHLRRLSAYIGNDTGFSHLASLIVERSLIVLGGGTFRRFFPWPNSVGPSVVHHGLECYDCVWNCIRAERFCLTRLTPADVHAAFLKALDSNEPLIFNVPGGDDSYPIAWLRGDDEDSPRHHFDAPAPR